MPTLSKHRGGNSPLFYGWYVVAASFAILFLTMAGSHMFGVMMKPMADDFGWSRSAISSAFLLNMAVYALSLIITGRLYDRYGPKWVIVGSTLLFSAGYALMATMGSLWQLVLYYGLIGAAGLGGVTVPIFGSIIGRWFKKQKGLAASLALAGSCLGQFFLIPVFSNLITSSGWRTTSLWIAGLCGVVGLGLAFGVIRGDPQKLGLQPYGAADPMATGAAAEPAVTAGAPPVAAGPRDLTLSEAMRSRSLWLYTVTMFACGGGDYFVSFHLVPMVTDYGLSTATGADMLAWLGLLSLAGILLAGPFSDWIGCKIPIALTFALRAVMFVVLIAFEGTVPFWVFSLGFGLTLAVTAPLTPMLVSTLYGVTHIGFISGFITTVHMVGGGLWAYLGGVVFDRTGDYRLAFILSAGLAAVAVVCTLLIREERHLPG